MNSSSGTQRTRIFLQRDTEPLGSGSKGGLLLEATRHVPPNNQSLTPFFARSMSTRQAEMPESEEHNLEDVKFAGSSQWRKWSARVGEILRDLDKGKKFRFTDLIHADVVDGQGKGGIQPLTFVRQFVERSPLGHGLVVKLVERNSKCSQSDALWYTEEEQMKERTYTRITAPPKVPVCLESYEYLIIACAMPQLMEGSQLPSDVVSRARLILDHCPGHTVGSINFNGIGIIREHVADYISERDGVKADINDVIICSGVTHGSELVMNALKEPSDGKPPGAMTCIPQFVRYHDLFRDFGIHKIVYPLDEDNGWTHSISRMQRLLDASRASCEPRFLLVVNPANPTAAVMSEKSIEDIVRFSYRNKLIILADEIFEHNIYVEHTPFHSFRKVMHKMGDPWFKTQLITFNSLSKGFMAEAGLHCGYFEIVNLNRRDKEKLLKAGTEVKASSLAQVALDCLVNPPKPGEPSYDLYSKEKRMTLEALKEKAELVHDRLNSIEGFYCSPIQGAMCAFPRVQLPQRAIDKAKRLGQDASYFYASQLLEKAGVCVTPGSWFGQVPGTCHFRVTILPPMAQLQDMLDRIKDFHEKFANEYN